MENINFALVLTFVDSIDDVMLWAERKSGRDWTDHNYIVE